MSSRQDEDGGAPSSGAPSGGPEGEGADKGACHAVAEAIARSREAQARVREAFISTPDLMDAWDAVDETPTETAIETLPELRRRIESSRP